jgi:hypothetical protein
MTTLWQDVLYGFRILSKKPGFTAHRRQVMGLMARQAMGVICIGVLVGVGVSLVLTRLLSS